MDGDNILETRSLTKEFKGFVAVKDVNLQVRRGSIHALIGPNGAGKTTVFNLLTKFLIPSSGQILFKLMQDWLANLTPQYWLFWIGLILVVFTLVSRERLTGGVAGLVARLVSRKPTTRAEAAGRTSAEAEIS